MKKSYKRALRRIFRTYNKYEYINAKEIEKIALINRVNESKLLNGLTEKGLNIVS